MQKLLLYIIVLFVCTQCAQITPLTGGKKDIDPPKAVKFEPENVSLNFNAKKIEIYFDEYIELKDVANQFIITPQTKELPEMEANGKKLTIKFNETLLPNTTYKLAFGNAIIDLKESNVLQNFEYVFSTGNTIDSLKLNGQVLNAFDNKPAPQLLIGLYPFASNDSVIYKNKPLYISKTADDGMFSFNYLPNTPFKLVGIKDQNKNLLYDGSEEQIAYSGNIVNPGSQDLMSLLLFKETPNKSFIKKSMALEYGKGQIIYNTPQYAIKSIIANGLIKYSQNKLKDTLTLYYSNVYDTLLTHINYQTKKADTVFIKIPTLETVEKQKKNGLFKYTLESSIVGVMPFYSYPQFRLNVPVESNSIVESKIYLVELKDSVKQKKAFTVLTDQAPVTSFTIQSDFKPETNYRLIFDDSVFIDNAGRRNDSITYNFKTTVIEDYGQLNLKLFFPKKEHYILMLLNDKEQVVEERLIEISLTSTSEKLVQFKNLLPGNYFIKVVEDANKNGQFDVGDYFLHRQPEIIFVNPTPIKLLAGWEIENEWQVK